jgi:endonuclease VIII-like 1
MPELAEVKLTADYVNKSTQGKIFYQVRKNPSHKGKLFEVPKSFKIWAVSRGKEFKLHFEHDGGTESLIMTMGMSGHFKLTKTGEEIKNSHLMFDATDGTTLSFVDVRRFGKWKFGDWNPSRGPDPVHEYSEFTKNILENLDKREFSKPLNEVLMNQKYFNGIGNYLRCEIVYRLEDINPFAPARDAILSSKGGLLLSLCQEIPRRAYFLGGGNLYSWKTPEELEMDSSAEEWGDFMKCYKNPNMNSIIDGIGRRFWYEPKWDKKII